MNEDLASRIEEITERLDLLEKRMEKREKKHALTIKEKFAIHDHAQSLIRWFEEMESQLSLALSPEAYKNLKEIIKTFSNLVDNALGLNFP